MCVMKPSEIQVKEKPSAFSGWFPMLGLCPLPSSQSAGSIFLPAIDISPGWSGCLWMRLSCKSWDSGAERENNLLVHA